MHEEVVPHLPPAYVSPIDVIGRGRRIERSSRHHETKRSLDYIQSQIKSSPQSPASDGAPLVYAGNSDL